MSGQHRYDMHRREVILGAGAGFIIQSGAVWAKGGGDGNEKSKTLKSGRPKSTSPKARYRQTEFRNLSKRQIAMLAETRGKLENGEFVVVEGFSQKMSTLLIRMMHHRRSSTRQLIRNMRRLKSFEARVVHLEAEIDNTRRQLADITDAKIRAESNKSTAAAEEAEQRIVQGVAYLEGLLEWLDNPHEGTRR